MQLVRKLGFFPVFLPPEGVILAGELHYVLLKSQIALLVSETPAEVDILLVPEGGALIKVVQLLKAVRAVPAVIVAVLGETFLTTFSGIVLSFVLFYGETFPTTFRGVVLSIFLSSSAGVHFDEHVTSPAGLPISRHVP